MRYLCTKPGFCITRRSGWSGIFRGRPQDVVYGQNRVGTAPSGADRCLAGYLVCYKYNAPAGAGILERDPGLQKKIMLLPEQNPCTKHMPNANQRA